MPPLAASGPTAEYTGGGHRALQQAPSAPPLGPPSPTAELTTMWTDTLSRCSYRICMRRSPYVYPFMHSFIQMYIVHTHIYAKKFVFPRFLEPVTSDKVL